MDSRFMTENSFAFSAGNNDSVVAGFICDLYEKAEKVCRPYHYSRYAFNIALKT